VNWISLSTSSLDICKGRDVVIDGDAYSLMWNVLNEINVKVERSLVGAVESGKSIKMSRTSFHSSNILLFFFFRKHTRPGTLNAMTHVPTSMPIPGPSQQRSHNDIK